MNGSILSRRRAHTIWIGPDHHLVHYPVSAGRYINLVAFAPAGGYTTESWTATATVDALLAEFDGWDERLRDIRLVRKTRRLDQRARSTTEVGSLSPS